MTESWVVGGSGVPLSSEVVSATLRARIAAGERETLLTSSSGRVLIFGTNSVRATVVLLEAEGSPAGWAVDPGAGGVSEGFVLGNGQHDEYRNECTVPLEEAFRIMGHIIDEGSPPADAAWEADH